MGQQTYFAIFAPPGRLAQLVQSTSFTPRGSGVRVPHRPPRTKHKSPCDAGAFCCPRTHQARMWAGQDGQLIWGQPSTLPGASRSTSPTTNKLPPTQITSSLAPLAKAPRSASSGESMTSPFNSGLTLATRFGAMARGMSAAHHQYVATSGRRAMTAEGSLSATAPQTTWSAPPRAFALF